MIAGMTSSILMLTLKFSATLMMLTNWLILHVNHATKNMIYKAEKKMTGSTNGP